MKLGILVTIISGFGKKGFYHSQEIGLARELEKLGHEVVIYKCTAGDQKEFSEDISSSVKIHYIPVKALGIHGNCPAEKIDPSLDGLLAFADTQLFLPHIYKFCRENRIAFVPYIGIAHSAQRNTKSFFMDKLFSATTLKIYQKIPVLAKTDEVKKELAELGVRKCKVTPVGLDESELKTDFREHDRNELRKKYGYEEDDVIISFVARLKSEKRPMELLDLFNEVKDQKKFRLLIVGEGYLREDMDARIREFGIEDKVQIIDRVPYEEMWEIHWISDYFLNLRFEEIFGMALMEGVYYESSVAAISGAGPTQILSGLEGHRICENDEEVKEWLLGPFPEKELLRQSSDMLIRRFSWKHCAKAFARLTEKRKQREELRG